MNYLTENNLLDYEDLQTKADVITGGFSIISDSIKSAEKRMAEVALLQKESITLQRQKLFMKTIKNLAIWQDWHVAPLKP